MDAVKFLKEKARMCDEYDCSDCPFGTDEGICAAGVDCGVEKTAEEVVAIIEKWSDEHQIKTRQSEFLKMYPDAELDGLGSLDICPASVDKNISCPEELRAKCLDCRKTYWLGEVD